MQLTFREAQWQDAQTLIALYNAAFYDDYMKYGECPAYGRSKDEMEVSILRFPKLIACYDGQPVGVISGQLVDEKTYEIGCLCVHPDFQRRGIGAALFDKFLADHDIWKCITLITPADNEANIRFYQEKCGMTVGETEINGKVEMIRLQKER